MALGSFVLLICFLSGDYCAVTVFDKKFGAFTPITIFFYGFVVYIAGLFDMLNLGIIIASAISVGAYVVSIAVCIKRRNLIGQVKKILGTTFVCFVLAFGLFWFCDYGQLATGSDDPNHWMSCVKVMTYSGRFYADPATQTNFPTYPPIVAIIELLIQKQYLFVIGGDFSEWIVFLTFHVTILSLFMPFVSMLEEEGKKKGHTTISSLLKCLLFLSAVLIVISVFYRDLYSSIRVDPLLACEASVVFMLILYQHKLECAGVYLLFLLPTITLTKDVGLLFAVFGVALYMITIRKESTAVRKVITAASTVVLSKLSWMGVIQFYGAVDPKPNKVDWIKYAKVLLGFEKYGEAYKNESINTFRNALFDRGITLGDNGIKSSYIIAIAIIVTIMIIQCLILRKRNVAICYIIGMLCLLVFIFGLGGVYVDRFVHTEAIRLASFERYVNALLCMLMLEVVCVLFIENDLHNKSSIILFVAPAILFAISPINNSLMYLKREYPIYEKKERELTDAFSQELLNACEPGSKIYFLSQSDYGIQYIYVQFMIRPNLSLQSIAGDDYNWCFVDSADSQNIYFKEMHSDAWKKEIFQSNVYDYFALMRCNEYFRREFVDCFESPDEIEENCIYRVDAIKEKLIRVCRLQGEEV